jgi:hypothetical protein
MRSPREDILFAFVSTDSVIDVAHAPIYKAGRFSRQHLSRLKKKDSM